MQGQKHNGHNLQQGIFQSEIKKNTLCDKSSYAMDHIAQRGCGMSSLEIFRTYLALSNLILFRSSPALSRKLEQITSRSLFQPKLFLILWRQKQALQVCIVAEFLIIGIATQTRKTTQVHKFPNTIKTHKSSSSRHSNNHYSRHLMEIWYCCSLLEVVKILRPKK